MFRSLRVAVVVPAYNERRFIRRVVQRVPSWVDIIVVVDDRSSDGTADVVRALSQDDPRVHLVRHSHNRGVGAAITTGYRKALELGADVAVVMAGDDQMDPHDLPELLEPLIQGQADYVKGNRLDHPEAPVMPWKRRLGTSVLGWLTARAIQVPSLHDSQCGYTAASARALRSIDLDHVWPGYGYPNDLLARFAAAGMRIGEVVVRPVYGEEASGLKARHVLLIAWLIARGAWMVRKSRSSASRFLRGRFAG